MVIYEVLNTFIRNNTVNATARFFKNYGEACSYLCDMTGLFHIKYNAEIKTGSFDEIETLNEYLLYDTNNPDNFTERFIIVTHQV